MNPTRRNTRTWTDEQLRFAVASQTSWRGVALALGLAAGSTSSIRRHVRRLAIDTSHLRGGRTWSDDDLRVAIEQADVWARVMAQLDIADTVQARIRVRSAAQRLGLDHSHLDLLPIQEAADRQDVHVLDTSRLHLAAESIAVAWLSLRGIPVAVPTAPSPYDLLATMPNGVRRVQVKSSSSRDEHGSWRIGIGHRQYASDRSAPRVPYDPDSVDYFFLVAGDGALFFIPCGVVAGRTTICTRAYEQYRVGDASSLFTTAA